MSTKQLDYEAPAKQYGAVSSSPAGVDYAALAKANGAISSTPAQAPERGILSKAYDVLTNPNKRAEFTAAMQQNASDSIGDKFAKGAGRMGAAMLTTPF